MSGDGEDRKKEHRNTEGKNLKNPRTTSDIRRKKKLETELDKPSNPFITVTARGVDICLSFSVFLISNGFLLFLLSWGL